MRFPFKRFLILLMMLVLPVQTFASAAMLGCAFSHQGPSSAPEMAQVAMANEAMPPCHQSEQPDTPTAKHNCKHCAACYLASALPIPSAVIVAITPPAQIATVLRDAPFIGFIADSPDRPPRTSFA